MGIKIPKDRITDFCRRWKITEFALFGSALREDFHTKSDVDVLVTFEKNSPWSLVDIVSMQEELKEIFGRTVDLVEKDALRNPFRRRAIIRESRVVYAS